jgi:putrescine transport system substrate-binding protein
MLRFVLLLLGGLWLTTSSALGTENPVVHVYNWSDYITEEAIEGFERRAGARVVYDVYDSNEVLEAKLLTGHSGYDVIFPTAKPFAQRHIDAGLYMALDQDLLPHRKYLDPEILAALAQDVDPGNRFVVPYMWGTTGLGLNVDKVRAALGEDIPLDSLALLFDPQNAERLADCGIALLDDETEVFGAALFYLGKDPNTTDAADFKAVEALIAKLRPHIRYFSSSQYISDLANGDICIALGYSGDVLQAADRALEAGRSDEIRYVIPREGAFIWTDVMAIPADAPHPRAAHAFINHLMDPEVIAAISNYVAYANANTAATPLLEEEIREDPGIYPPPEVKQRLRSSRVMPADVQRLKVRSWTRIKSGR